MFNESCIFGSHTSKRDEKNRIFLPAFTGAESGDILVIVRTSLGYKIIAKSVFDKALDAIETEIAKLIRLDKKVVTVLDLYSKSEDNEELRMLESYRDSLCCAVVRQTKVDSQRRIIIGDIYEGEKELYLVGARNSLMLLNKEDYLTLNNKSVNIDDKLNVKKLG